MEFWHNVEAASGIGWALPWSLAGGVVAALLLATLRPAIRSRMRGTVLLLLLGLVVAAADAGLSSRGIGDGAFLLDVARFVGELCLALAWIAIVTTLVFNLVLPGLGIDLPPILIDASLGFIYVATLLFLLAANGVNLSGIVATSAVLTGIIGFSMQDTLGNLVGGISLQAERTIAVGDWIRVDGVEGVVRATRWRQTAIETRDTSTVVIPNTLLTKAVVTVLGRHGDQTGLLRATVTFEVDVRHAPETVLDVVLRAVSSADIADVLPDPPPSCLFAGIHQGTVLYQLFFWTTAIPRLPIIASDIRRLVVVALRRADIVPGAAPQPVALTSDRDASAGLDPAERDRRVASVGRIGLFDALTDAERYDLAGLLKLAPFRQGERISRQGEAADYLYILNDGQADVTVAADGGPASHVATLGAGDVFGEMGMMTGEPRTATVRALTDLTCYRLDKASFRSVLQARPELAEAIATLLAERKAGLDSVIRDLGAPGTEDEPDRLPGEILRRIRRFVLLA